MKKLFERAVAAVRANPFKSLTWAIAGVFLFALWMALGDPLGREIYMLIR